MSILHRIGDLFCLSQNKRNHLMSVWRRWTHWRPAWYRRTKEYGLNRAPRDVKITVSVTTFPARIKAVGDTIDTLLNQTVKPDRVVLWLGEDKFPKREAQLPKRLLNLREFGLTIGWCRDQRSFTKLLPALKTYPDDILITCDDDILYNPDLVETLYAAYRKDPTCVHTQAAMRFESDGRGGLKPYNDLWYCKTNGEKSYANLLMGANGVLYPPHILPDEVFKEEVFRRLAPTTDDLWFWAMSVLGGHRICNLDANGVSRTSTNYQVTGPSLWAYNISVSKGNDPQLRAILEAYPVVRERLFGEL